MAQRPLVSIVTPTLNRLEFLRSTIESIRAQTFVDYEHIVVDGVSTDGTIEHMTALEGKYPLRWISEPDSGMYDAINKGLAMARGDIVAYLNSDDLYFPWTLQLVVNAFRRDPSADLVFGDLLTVDDKSGEQGIEWMMPFDLDYIRRVGFMAQPTVFMRRRVLEVEGPFDESLRYLADCDYWMRIGSRQRFKKINEFLAVERNHAGTLRASDSAIWSELNAVRVRYVSLSGKRHDRALQRHRVRNRFWFRLYWTGMLLQSMLPRAVHRGPWSQLLGAGETSVDRPRVLLMLVPRFGARFANRLLRPSRYWLEPERLSRS